MKDKNQEIRLLNRELKKENLRLQKMVAKLQAQLITAKNDAIANRKAPAPINPIFKEALKRAFSKSK